MAAHGSPDRVLVLNPESGSGDHVAQVEELAADEGFEVRRTDGAGDAARLAREAAGADTIAACGGDGTVNEVVMGLYHANALDDVDVGVVPAGTGNNFASNIGITGIEHGFDVLEGADRRRLDLGIVEKGAEPPDGPGDECVFTNSCVVGLTADASRNTSADSKSRMGVLAYVVETLRTVTDFEGLSLSVRTGDGDGWRGEALLLLVGNARRFPGDGRTQADVEDGAFEVVVIEERPAIDLASETAMAQLLGRNAEHLERFRTPELTIDVEEGETTFSLDGEMVSSDRLALRTDPGALSVSVGEDYRPAP